MTTNNDIAGLRGLVVAAGIVGPVVVGRVLSNNALCLIHDGDSVLCEFGGAHNYCTEHPEYADLAAAALSALPALLSRLEANSAFFSAMSSGIGMVKMAAMRGDCEAVLREAEKMSLSCDEHCTALTRYQEAARE